MKIRVTSEFEVPDGTPDELVEENELRLLLVRPAWDDAESDYHSSLSSNLNADVIRLRMIEMNLAGAFNLAAKIEIIREENPNETT